MEHSLEEEIEDKLLPHLDFDRKGVGILKIILLIIFICVFLAMWFLYTEIYVSEAQSVDEVTFMVEDGESVGQIADRLEEKQIIRNAWIFKKYLVFKNMDKEIQSGQFKVVYPITLARVASSLKSAIRQDEEIITIIPGWDLRDIAEYLQEKGIIGNKNELYSLLGESAVLYDGVFKKAPKLSYNIKLLDDKSNNVSYEGYLAPDTYRIFVSATLEEVVEKLINQQNKLITSDMYRDAKNAGRSIHDILTMASILEREVRTPEDKAKVADIFWRRYENSWALQADSTVHYAVNKSGDVFTTQEDRNSTNPWNTYQYAGLPPGPISSPSLGSIKAAIYPQKNNNWYFLTTLDGEVKYAQDLDGHNKNVQKYLR